MPLATSQSPSASNTIRVVNSKTFVGNNDTNIKVPLFRITGTIKVVQLYGVVTTELGTVHTSPYFDMYDQSIRVDITSASLPPDASGYDPGSILYKGGKSSAALIGKPSSSTSISEAATVNQPPFQEIIIATKNGANNDLEYVYTTTDTPTTGAMDFYLEFQPLSADASVTLL